MSHSLIYKHLHASTPVYTSISLRHHSQKEMLKHLHQHTYLQFVRMLLSYHETKEYSNKRISPSLLSDTYRIMTGSCWCRSRILDSGRLDGHVQAKGTAIHEN